MSLEQESRKNPTIDGIPVKLRDGGEFIISPPPIRPIFEEQEDGQWLFQRFEFVGRFHERFEKVHSVWNSAGQNGKIVLSSEQALELQKNTLELVAMALKENYDLTPEQVGELVDPMDQEMIMSIMLAMRGQRFSDLEKDKKEDEEKSRTNKDDSEKKNSGRG